MGFVFVDRPDKVGGHGYGHGVTDMREEEKE